MGKKKGKEEEGTGVPKSRLLEMFGGRWPPVLSSYEVPWCLDLDVPRRMRAQLDMRLTLWQDQGDSPRLLEAWVDQGEMGSESLLREVLSTLSSTAFLLSSSIWARG